MAGLWARTFAFGIGSKNRLFFSAETEPNAKTIWRKAGYSIDAPHHDLCRIAAWIYGAAHNDDRELRSGFSGFFFAEIFATGGY